MRVVFLSALLAFGLDQASKFWVVHVLDLRNLLAIDVLPPLLNFRMGWNTGINFGLFSDSPDVARWLLIGLALGISLCLLYWMRHTQRKRELICAGLIIGGALGNVVDRLIYGAVADFLNMSCCGINNPFTFNVADIFIFAGAFGLILFGETKKGA